MPVAHRADEARLHATGLVQLLGLQPDCLECARGALRSGAPRHRARAASSALMVDALHDAGLEVVLDVVYNHTAET